MTRKPCREGHTPKWNETINLNAVLSRCGEEFDLTSPGSTPGSPFGVHYMTFYDWEHGTAPAAKITDGHGRPWTHMLWLDTVTGEGSNKCVTTMTDLYSPLMAATSCVEG